MLEPVREYAAERLAARADARAIADRHSRYYVELAETVAPKLLAADQLAWQRRLDAEADNFQEALEREHRAGDAERVVRLATALREWWRRGTSVAGAGVERAGAGRRDRPAGRAARRRADDDLPAQRAAGRHRRRAGLRRARRSSCTTVTGDARGKTIALVAIAVCHAAARRRAGRRGRQPTTPCDSAATSGRGRSDTR